MRARRSHWALGKTPFVEYRSQTIVSPRPTEVGRGDKLAQNTAAAGWQVNLQAGLFISYPLKLTVAKQLA